MEKMPGLSKNAQAELAKAELVRRAKQSLENASERELLELIKDTPSNPHQEAA